VTAAVAAKMIVEGTAMEATEDQATEFRGLQRRNGGWPRRQRKPRRSKSRWFRAMNSDRSRRQARKGIGGSHGSVTDGPVSSIEDLTAQDSQLQNVANVEGST